MSSDGGSSSEVGEISLRTCLPKAVLRFFLALALTPALGAQSAGYIVTTVAGLNSPGFSGDGGPALFAALDSAGGLAVDAAGNTFVADTANSRIRKISPQGVITTVAGNGANGFGGDGGPAASAQLSYAGGGDTPQGLAVDALGNLFFADVGNNRIRKVTPQGIVSTVAGNGTAGFGGDGGPATLAELNRPIGIALDTSGNLFIADSLNYRIRKVTAAGTIVTVAGNGNFGFSGDGGPAISAAFSSLAGIAVDGGGNLYIADYSNSRIREVTTQGVMATVAGGGSNALGDDPAMATAVQLTPPSGIAVDGFGNVFMVDRGYGRIREVTTQGLIVTMAGSGSGGDGGPATAAALWAPSGIAVSTAGVLTIFDAGTSTIRQLIPAAASRESAPIRSTGRIGAFRRRGAIICWRSPPMEERAAGWRSATPIGFRSIGRLRLPGRGW